ncbi:hypothetical protein V2J09_014179 [Rumex salicifolius]
MIKCLVIVVLVLSASSSSSSMGASEIAKPGCPDHCGGVKIPFPFGFGRPDCYFNRFQGFNGSEAAYRIKCDNTTNPPTPFISDIQSRSYHKILSINVDDHSLRISSKVAFECYTVNSNGFVPSSNLNNNTYRLVPNVWPFNISATRNRLIAVGCDTTARVGDNMFLGDTQDSVGCMTSCQSLDYVGSINGTCSGRGCCQTSIFNTMYKPSVSVGSLANHSLVIFFNPCSFAFVGEVGSYKFSRASLTVSAKEIAKIRVPVVYDWSVDSRNCSDTKKAENGSLLCGGNTRCVDGDDIHWGYRCQCLDGYTGNPYLSRGCQGNIIGGFECQCPKGFHGSATSKDPCIPDPGSAKLLPGLSMGMGSMIGLVILYGIYKLLKKRKEVKEREQYFKKNGGLLLQQELSTNEGTIDRTKIFSRSELEKATDNFNDNRVLGRGGQGTVYKGMSADGTIVAVKKSKTVDEHQLSQFINEVVILSQINHRNVVKLFGCCLETEVPMLVYEFVPNGTLYQHIHHPIEDFRMTWRVRFQIALECAEAIAYLHSSCSSPIYHRDIKSSNILLDEKYKAKVSDFGASRTISIDKTHVTTFVQGTFGYLDPEFFRSSQFSEKSDVYSFGVVLLELITSKKPIFTDTSGEPRGLATEFVELMESNPNQLRDILDTQVLQNCNDEEIDVLAKLIERCLHLNGRQRPTMREVAITLDMVKSGHDEHTNDPIDHGVSIQQGHQTSLANEGLASITSSFTTSSYSMDGEPFEKSDVYSFGVTLLELITSKKPIFTDSFGESRGLATEFVQLMESNPNQLHNILDPQVSQNCSDEEIDALVKLIERCLHLDGRQRPIMKELATALDMIKSQHDEHTNDPIDHRAFIQQGHQASLANEGLASTASSFTTSSFSINVEPLL